MNEEEINIIVTGKVYSEIEQLLQKFLKTNEKKFNFSYLNENHRGVTLWTGLFQHIQDKSAESIHASCLATIRLLSRDKSELDNVICEKWIIVLIDKAGLYNFMDVDDESMDVDMPHKEVVVEALKCLCNLSFNSEVARALCAQTSIAKGLVARLRSYKEIPFKDDIMLYDMKLIFILTALRQDVKMKIKDELHGMDYLISCLNELVREATTSEVTASNVVLNHCYFSDPQQAIACEILKTQFNLILHSGADDDVSEEDEAMYLKLMPSLTTLLYAQSGSEENQMELHSNIANLLTSVPPAFYQYLTPVMHETEAADFIFDGRNMDALQVLLELFQYRLTITTSTKNQYENLSPILTVLNKSARGCRVQRKYLRQKVLPPLRDVSLPPEKGNTLRNQLCRLLTTPVTSVRDLVAEFLFILCKEKVGRMVKYTGFGNAAGHLAQKGLMGGARGPVQYSSSSEDSDTEEYLQAQPSIDPVMGCTRPPRSNPFEGMSEEQKEVEAMKLVDLFDRMVSHGVVRPAAMGPDGRPQPLQHVLQLRDEVLQMGDDTPHLPHE